jgi:hypothetical protein
LIGTKLSKGGYKKIEEMLIYKKLVNNNLVVKYANKLTFEIRITNTSYLTVTQFTKILVKLIDKLRPR